MNTNDKESQVDTVESELDAKECCEADVVESGSKVMYRYCIKYHLNCGKGLFKGNGCKY